MFAFGNSFEQLAIARFMMGLIGAGFVVGIRMVSEWFPANELGTAEGIYGGWGNFGSAAAAFTLPTVAVLFGGEDGWRYAIAITGVMSLLFSFIYYSSVSDTPKGSIYFRPKRGGAMEVTSKSDFFFLLFMKLPMYLTLGLLAWKLQKVGMLDETITNPVYIGLVILYLVDAIKTYDVNKDIFVKEVPEIERYKFKQVAVLNVLYFSTFGSELAEAGMVASSYAFMNLMSRPGGGWISDRFGRKKTLLILTAGLAVGYYAMSQITGSWPLVIAVLAAMACSFFVQAGEGAVFAAVPLIKRRLTGQIAGMTGAYGNVGAVFYLTVYSMVSTQTFFYVIAITAVLGFIALLMMEEPSGHIAEVDENGEVTLINVS